MDAEKMQFVITGVNDNNLSAEITIREGKAPEMLPNLPPVKHSITGTIGAPYEFLLRRIPVIKEWLKDSEAGSVSVPQINIDRCHILVNRKDISIKLVINENDPNQIGNITGVLEEHPKFKEFGINQGKSWEPNELGQFLKMNKFFFAESAENMKLVTALKNFEANINAKIEKQKADNGEFKDNYSGAVLSNLPGSFKVNIPIFKGLTPETIEVEFFASVNGRTASLQLVSPGANQLLEAVRDSVIDEQIEQIRGIAPTIVIIEI